MGLAEADGEEEGLFAGGEFFHAGDGGLGDSAVVVFVIVDLTAIFGGETDCSDAGFFLGALRFLLRCDSFWSDVLFAEPAALGFFGPTLGEVVVMGVVDFSDVDRFVAELFEMLGHGKGIGVHLTHGCFEVPAAGGLRTESGHETGAGSTANRDLAVGALEEGSACGEGVDVGRVDAILAVAVEFGSEVIDRDEEDVEPLCAKS